MSGKACRCAVVVVRPKTNGASSSLRRFLLSLDLCLRGNILAMEGQGNRPGLEEIRNRIQALRHEIENLRRADQQQRLSRQSQVSWDSQKQHETRVARMDEIEEELVKLGRGMK